MGLWGIWLGISVNGVMGIGVRINLKWICSLFTFFVLGMNVIHCKIVSVAQFVFSKNS
jgi:hypothetical protein